MLTNVDMIIEDRIRTEVFKKGRGVAVARVVAEQLEELTFVTLESWRGDPLIGFEGDISLLNIIEDYDLQKQYVVIIAKQVGRYADVQAYLRRYRNNAPAVQSA